MSGLGRRYLASVLPWGGGGEGTALRRLDQLSPKRFST